MRLVFFIALLFLSTAEAVELCDILEQPEITNITSLGVRNCIEENKLFEESDDPGQGPICQTCRRSSFSISDSDRKKLKQEAYIKEMASEYKKAMAVLLLDLVALRKMNSTNGVFTDSIRSCSANNLNNRLSGCGQEQRRILNEMNFSQLIPNELASLLNQNPQSDGGLLTRNPQDNQCSISDQTISRLTPLVLENTITPDFVEQIASVTVLSSDAIFESLGSNIGLFKNHPILMAMTKEPARLINFFKSLRGVPQAQLSNRFKAALNTPENASLLDREISGKCNQAINNFTAKICSSQFDQGKISLGPFSNFERFNNDNIPDPNPEFASSPDLLARNLTMLEFCDAPSPGDLQIPQDTEAINSFLPSNLRSKPYRQFDSEVYYASVGTLKSKLCEISRGRKSCTAGFECQLYELYQSSLREGSPEFRLANSVDPGINNILRSMVGNPTNLSASTKTVLIAEGILPQSNGQFVERPQIPERQPEYLAGVANGTITPNAGTTTSASAATSRTRRPTQTQAQVFQPNQGNAAVSEAQLADTSEDDQEALRRFEQGLDDRLRRIESQRPVAVSATTRTNQPNRRQASRPDSSGRTNNRSQSAEIISVPQAPATPEFTDATTAGTTGALPEARLGEDPGRRTLAERQRNAALANMSGARANPAANAEAGRGPASVDESFRPESALTLNISPNANLEQVLTNNRTLQTLIQEQRPFRFRLNNNLFDVQFNNGVYTVAFRSGDNRGRDVASRLQSIFNNSLRRAPSADRNATLEGLGNTLRN